MKAGVFLSVSGRSGCEKKNFRQLLQTLKLSNIFLLEIFNQAIAQMTTSNKVMIVEDNMLLSVVQEKIVSQLGYDVVGKAVSGEEVLDRIDALNPDILLVDVQLAGILDGIETVKRLRDSDNNIPVIFLSGNTDLVHKQRASEVNCVAYLAKPVNETHLESPLKRASEFAKSEAHAA